MLHINANARRGTYDDSLRQVLNIRAADESRAWLSAWDGLNAGPTPLWDLPDIALKLGVGSIRVKDEGHRSPLGSFKALGAPIALIRLIRRLFEEQDLDPTKLFNGDYKALLHDFTAISATDGNHGRALAAAARSIGCRCVIVLHKHVNDERRIAIEMLGAEIVQIEGNYDESVKEAARLAKEHAWHVVSDTSYEGYEAIPRDVMQGYGTIAAEALEQNNSRPYTHVFVQGGVGGLAAGVISYFAERDGERRPRFVIVEPMQADCLYQSALKGAAANAEGSVDSVMAGLACGETSPLAWRFLNVLADAFMTIPDEAAIEAMRILAIGSTRDIPIVSGESGAAGLAGLMHASGNAEERNALGLDKHSQVLLLNTEGATAPALYRELTSLRAEDVLCAQRKWREGQATTVTFGSAASNAALRSAAGG
ncbi:PLP-dependent lyase/thiolase [Burkholderia sp. Leaf177]|uniref:diaminopropionate ammonia-lyase n=1 Tax=Burkholderia sp. Leaf177 TaxID=1736287 RepID=UPI0006FE4AF3|nr:diaminopropionate ammonia-lyase [Burkholderia sp. Leaf177]KQR73606.1 PLP-dependent lyase/thiolase [Burkholderia sp. Leaf177]